MLDSKNDRDINVDAIANGFESLKAPRKKVEQISQEISQTPKRQSADEKARQLEDIEHATGNILDDAQDVSRKQRVAIAQKIARAYANLSAGLRRELTEPSRRWRHGLCAIIEGRNVGFVCGDTGVRAALYFDTLVLIEAPIMVLDKEETHEKAWRIIRGVLPAFCDLKGRAWVEEQLEIYKSDFERIMVKHVLDGGLKPPLLIRPVDIAWAHQIRLEELRAYQANHYGLTSIDPETPEEKLERDREYQEERRRDRDMKPQKDRTLTRDREAYAERHGITVYEVKKRMRAGTLTREELQGSIHLRQNVSRHIPIKLTTLFGEPPNAMAMLLEIALDPHDWAFEEDLVLT